MSCAQEQQRQKRNTTGTAGRFQKKRKRKSSGHTTRDESCRQEGAAVRLQHTLFHADVFTAFDDWDGFASVNAAVDRIRRGRVSDVAYSPVGFN